MTSSQEAFVVCVIPMRLGSTRLKEKMLAPIGRQSLAQRCVGRALEIFKDSPKVYVVAAVDSEVLQKHLIAAHPKVQVVMTDPEIPSGTDRVAVALGLFLSEKKLKLENCLGVINLQGDIPFVGTEGLKKVADYYFQSSTEELEKIGMITLAQEFPQDMNYEDPAAVKVIKDNLGRALYFSRLPIPHSKVSAAEWLKDGHDAPAGELHIGVYAYTPKILARFCSHAPTNLDLAEGLEQLRALWLGIEILVVSVEIPPNESFRGIDTKNDLEWAQKFIREPS